MGSVNTYAWKYGLQGVYFAALFAYAWPCHVQAQTTSVLNACETSGDGKACASDADCAENAYAKTCVSNEAGIKSCKIPCQTARGEKDDLQCASGEMCVADSSKRKYYCNNIKFQMDLNMLDNCISYFVNNHTPSFDTGSTCSIEANLSQLLDQNKDGLFDIFDADLCLSSFFKRKKCTSVGCEDPNDVFCENDTQCGNGSFCDQDVKKCTRECGVLYTRETGELLPLVRPCFGDLKTCNYTSGKCEDVLLQGLTCQIDQNCPNGAYCFMGECAPKCSQNIDCLDSEWTCSANNTCQPRAESNADADVAFNPRDYNILVADKRVAITDIANTVDVPLVVMDIYTKEQIFDSPEVAFGYRTQVTYGLKEDSKCLADENTITCSDLADCTVSPNEEFVAISSPVGVVRAFGNPQLNFQLNTYAASKLSPGSYVANVTVVFSNGATTSFTLNYVKSSPDGQYGGELTLAADNRTPMLTSHMQMDLKIFTSSGSGTSEALPTVGCVSASNTSSSTQMQWSQLLRRLNVAASSGFEDTSTGYLVMGALDGNKSIGWSNPEARKTQQNTIPVYGLYQPSQGVLRLISVLDIPQTTCVNESGESCALSSLSQNPLSSQNIFKRNIRRLMQWNATFNPVSKQMQGFYKETITGLLPDASSVSGTFVFKWLGASNLSFDPQDMIAYPANTSSFPSVQTIVSNVSSEGAVYCQAAQNYTYEVAQNYDTKRTTFCSNMRSSLTAYSSTSSRTTDQATLSSIESHVQEFCSYVSQDMQANGSVEERGEILRVKGIASSYCDSLPARNQNASNVKEILDLIKTYTESAESSVQPFCSNTNAVFSTNRSLTAHFVSEDNFLSYSRGYVNAVPWGKNRIFENQENFSEGISNAILRLGNQNVSSATSTIHDFLRGDKTLCGGNASGALSCVDSNSMRCGIAMYKKALLSGWQGTLLPLPETGVKNELFCRKTTQFENCFSTDIALSSYQEHNRFFTELLSGIIFEQNGLISDAFFDVFKSGSSLGIERRQALFRKRDKFIQALAQFYSAEELMVETSSAKLFYEWPMSYFRTNGKELLDQFQTEILDGIDTLIETIAIKRKEFVFTNKEEDFVFANHVIQNQFLVQIYLMQMQKKWEGNSFNYSGYAYDWYKKVKSLSVQLDPEKNSLGFSKDKVYFEGVSPNEKHWKFYRKLLVEGPPGAGFIDKAKVSFDNALEQSTLADQQAFTSSLLEEQQAIEEELYGLCGEDTAFRLNCRANRSSGTCTGDGCTAMQCFSGGSETCLNPMKSFQDTNGDSCPYYNQEFNTVFRVPAGNPNGRRCGAGGEMAQYLIQLLQLAEERDNIIQRFNSFKQRTAKIYQSYKDTIAAQSSQNTEQIKFERAIKSMEITATTISETTETIRDATQAADCMIVAGLAFGTNCAGKAIATTLSRVISVAAIAVRKAMDVAKGALEIQSSISAKDYELEQAKREIDRELTQMASEFESYGYELENVMNEIDVVYFNIDEVIKKATRAIDMSNARFNDIVSSLIGKQTGYTLLKNQNVVKANADINQIASVAYRMVNAFKYDYNLSSGDGLVAINNIMNKVFGIMTPEDAEDIVYALDDLEASNCGREGYDCDEEYNSRIFRMSLREELYPTLRDVIDPRTGTVLTKGQQFFNLMLTSQYVKRRVRPGLTSAVDQIEIPFAIWANARPDIQTGKDKWMLSPFECNHYIGQANGDAMAATAFSSRQANMAVFARGNMSGALRYEMWRGNVDYIRSCVGQTVTPPGGGLPRVEHVIHKYSVGYVPVYTNSIAEVSQSFSTHTSSMVACPLALDEAELTTPQLLGDVQEACFQYFARDRSLSAPDWKIVIPLYNGSGNEWIFDIPDAGEENPSIEDIIVYFRYKSRPVR
jgi:hypothetical protein